VIWQEQFTSHRILLHPSGFVGKGAPSESRCHVKPPPRSPSGNLIITKLPRAIKIWTQDGVCRKTIERFCPVQSITWLPHGEGKFTQQTLEGRLVNQYPRPAFLSIEESSIVRLVC